MSKKAKTKAITLLIEAHGDEILDIEINVPYVHLLSFSGRMGQLGDFGKVGDESLELHILESLRNLYLGKSSAQQQSNVYNGDKLRAQLRTLYEEKAGKGYPSGGFFKTNPVRERTFYFKPNRHEDCRRCRKAKKLVEYSDGSMGPNPEYARVCVPNRKISSRDCPVYGLIVVASSDPDDKQFTLEGETGEGFDALSSANLHMNGGAELHWFQKIDGTKFPQASSAFEHMIEKRDISLTQLSKIFEAMGYTDIYILDPSCRSTFTEQPKLKSAVHSYWERNPRDLSSVSNAVTWARPIPSPEVPEPEVTDETPDMEIDNGVKTTVDSQGRTWSCDINGMCVLIGAATGAIALKAGVPSGYAAATGAAATGLARYAAYKALGRGGRKSKKYGKNKNRKNKTTKRRNKNKTRKHK